LGVAEAFPIDAAAEYVRKLHDDHWLGDYGLTNNSVIWLNSDAPTTLVSHEDIVGRVSMGATVKNLKDVLEGFTLVCPARQVLSHAGPVLVDDTQLSDSIIELKALGWKSDSVRRTRRTGGLCNGVNR
jgi:hypothetical protein